MRFLWMAIAVLLVAAPASAQHADPRSMIRLASEGAPAVQAAIGDLAWLEGSWVGDMEGVGVQHEILGSAFGQMPGFVRALGPDNIAFYEITTFAEVGPSVSYRVKHFTPALAGWEPQDAYIDRPLLGREEATLFFDGITFQRTGADSFTVYYLDRTPEGAERATLVIPFTRRVPGS